MRKPRVPVNEEALRKEISFKEHIDASLFSRDLVSPGPNNPPPTGVELTERERKLALRPTAQFNYASKPMIDWLNEQHLQRTKTEGEVDFARRVFHSIATKFKYDYRGEQDRSAANVCSLGKSDCGGLSALFVAALRSQGIPAHTQAGRWAKSSVPGERMGEVEYFQEHVKAEFYA